MLALHSFRILSLPTLRALLQGSIVCLGPKSFLRSTNQTPEYYHVAYWNQVLQCGLNLHGQPSSCWYSNWQQTHVDTFPMNLHWEDGTGFQQDFTVFRQQRVYGRMKSIPLGKTFPWNSGGKYRVVDAGSFPKIYLPCPNSFPFPGLLIIASLQATQVSFPFLKLLIQAQEPWLSHPSLTSLQLPFESAWAQTGFGLSQGAAALCSASQS